MGGTTMPDSLVTRPLRTGRKFCLVIPELRIFLLRWDKAEYDGGVEAELSVEGRQLGSDPLELRVERQDDRGSWGPVATVRAQVNGDGTHAACKWKFPDDRADRFRFRLRTAEGRAMTSGIAELDRSLAST